MSNIYMEYLTESEREELILEKEFLSDDPSEVLEETFLTDTKEETTEAEENKEDAE